jgi:hypothetical protein
MLNLNHLGLVYSKYCTASSPASLLHEAASFEKFVSLTRAQGGVATQARPMGGAFYRQALAKKYAAGAAALGSGAFKAVDGLVGTGVHSNKNVKIDNGRALAQHLGEVARALPDTGLAGLMTGALVGMPLGLGAAGGACVTGLGLGLYSLVRAMTGHGFRVPQAKQAMLSGSALGVVTGALVFSSSLMAAALWMTAVGVARVATGLLKGCVAGVLYGAGYGTGYVVARLQQVGAGTAAFNPRALAVA